VPLRRREAVQACSSIPRAQHPGREISEPTWNPPHVSGLDLPYLDANAVNQGSFQGLRKKLGGGLDQPKNVN
jgi:hypothetical protein